VTERATPSVMAIWRGRIEAFCTVGLTASALVRKRCVRLPMVACGSLLAGRGLCHYPSDATPISRLIDIGRAPKGRVSDAIILGRTAECLLCASG
jgi:hypothetical protein